MPVLSKADILAAQKGNNQRLGVVLNEIDQTFVRLQQQGGYLLGGEDTSQLLGTPPQPPVWTVAGVDGKFIVRIVPAQVNLSQQASAPNINPPQDPTTFTALPLQVATADRVQTRVLYQIQSSLTPTFDATGSVVNYPSAGISDQLSYDIADHPNETRYWQIRARYLNSQFTAWYPLLGPQGMLAVSSGFERSTTIAPRSPLNNTNDGQFDSIDAGASATLRGYSQAGGVGTAIHILDGQGGSRNIGAMTIAGAAYTTQYSEVWSIARLFEAFPSLTQYPIADDDFYMATVTTVAAGGAGGSSGGGGTGGGGGVSGSSGGRRIPDL
jgi:hypothetical protein